MSDFSFTNYVSRDEVADSLRENEEQLVYVLGRLGNEVDLADIEDLIEPDRLESGSDLKRIASFYRDFADILESA